MRESITCPQCKKVSHHPMDVLERYCGNCHQFHDTMVSMYKIKYRHDDCKVKPGVEWEDVWDCAVNGECPACGTDDIEPVDWDIIDNENQRRHEESSSSDRSQGD